MLNGEILENGQTIADYNMSKNTVLTLFFTKEERKEPQI